jgi:hypothetical protein
MLPKPKENETQSEFLARAIDSPSIKNEFKTNAQRISVATALWENADKKEEETSGHFVKIEKSDPIHKIVKGVVYSALDVDTDGETMTVEDVQKACWNFLAQRKEKNIDIQHDWQESGCYVVESYMTEKDDPNFPENSWVMAVKCTDEIFEKVVNGELNGFSFGGYSEKFAQKVLLEVAKQIVGETNENLNKDIIPAHKHQFILWYDNNGKIVKGTTDTVFDHMHTITYGTATDKTLSHSHGVDINRG